MTSAVPLATTDDARATAVLARAFEHYPLMVYLTPDGRRRRRVLPRTLGSIVRYCSRYGSVTTTPDVTAVAAWLPPGQTNTTVSRMARAGILTSAVGLGPAGLRRMATIVPAMERGRHALQPSPHWYLWLLGTEPSLAGTGLGGALLEPGLARADTDGVDCYLDTHDPRTLRFYARHGFEPVIEELTDGLRWWGLRRPATPSSR